MNYLKCALGFCVAICLSANTLLAQDNLEDVVYLKNGNIYRGLIIEQVPGESIKIKTIGGNVFGVQISDIQKLTKEEKIVLTSPTSSSSSTSVSNTNSSVNPVVNDTMVVRVRKPWERKRGYLMQVNFIADFLEFGVRVVNGYKINRYAQIGIGLGVDGVVGAPQTIFRGDFGDYSGVFFPAYLYFGGEILKKRFTPYYAVEAGYAFARNNHYLPMGNSSGSIKGGPMGSVGFGGRVHIKKYFNITVLFNLNVKNIAFERSYYETQGQVYIQERRRETFFFPGVRLGLGF